MGTFSDGTVHGWLDSLTVIWVKLHLGDPGAAGTTNPAANTTRMQATCGAASGRARTNTVAIEWTNVPNLETYSHVSLWDAETAGNFLGRDDLSAPAAVEVGDTFRIPIGDLDLSIT